ncbi:MAG: NYN domain-containing protein [Patescibacteria group bacterium]|nr:NYN domain-containing protein [Patescibacteria group bacterium]
MQVKDKKGNNYAFIDGQNLNLSIRELGWGLDERRFRTYLKEKYNVQKAYYFIGFMSENNDLYNNLQSNDYILIFKPTLKNKEGKVKGNCDADLVLQAMIDYKNYDKAVLVTSDGDFYCLAKYLRENNKLLTVLAPNIEKCSILLKRSAGKQITFMNDLKQKLAFKRKGPRKDKTLQGTSHRDST